MSPVEPSVAVDVDTLVATRRSLHGVAETVVAGPQFRGSGTMRLRVRPGGFATSVPYGEVSLVAVELDELVVVRGEQTARLPLTGTYGALAEAAGLPYGGLEEAYRDGAKVAATDGIAVDRRAAERLAWAWAVGDSALRALGGPAADGGAAPEPVLWPEHFDVGITLAEVNYGISPGDEAIPEPYAYVGPPIRPKGPFWNHSFGAGRTLRELPDADAVLAFFSTGRRLAGG